RHPATRAAPTYRCHRGRITLVVFRSVARRKRVRVAAGRFPTDLLPAILHSSAAWRSSRMDHSVRSGADRLMDADTNHAGSVAAIWRYPVKSMRGEALEKAEVSEWGVFGDRAYALVDGESGKVVSAKNPRKWGDLFAFRADFPHPGDQA